MYYFKTIENLRKWRFLSIIQVMKTKIKILISCLLAAVLFTSCLSTVSEIVGKPTVKLDSVSLKSLDMEGFTFKAVYSVSNPYPVSFSVAGLNADVIYNSDSLTSMSASEGITVSGMDTARNTLSFKIPYKTILKLASGSDGKSDEYLPMNVKGSVKLDLSSVPLFEGETLTLPFTKSFNVPVFKPSFSVSAPALQMPTRAELKDALVNGGMSAVKAASLAANIIAGNKLSPDALDGVDLDLKFNFNLNVKNEGSCKWNFLLDNCKITSGDNRIASVSPVSGNVISSQSGTIPVTCKLNTVQSGRYIVQLLNKTAANPVVTIDSVLNFPGVADFMSNIPLDYSKEISVSSITKK